MTPTEQQRCREAFEAWASAAAWNGIFKNAPDVAILGAFQAAWQAQEERMQKLVEALETMPHAAYCNAPDPSRLEMCSCFKRNLQAILAAHRATMQEQQNSGILEQAAIAGECGHGPEGCDTLPAREGAPAPSFSVTDTEEKEDLMEWVNSAIEQEFTDQIPSKMITCENGVRVITITKDCVWSLDTLKIAIAAMKAMQAYAGESSLATIATEEVMETVPPSSPAPASGEISLDACKRAMLLASNSHRSIQNADFSFTEFCVVEPEKAVKAVLDAAGVKHFDPPLSRTEPEVP
jgi:hypothetical protein